MSDLPDFNADQIEQRLVELAPLVTEYRRLQAAREALVGLCRGSERSRGDGEDEVPRAGGGR